MAKQLFAIYSCASQWDLDKLGVDLEQVFHWEIKWDRLHIWINEEDEDPVEFEPNVIRASDPHFLKIPKSIASGDTSSDE